MLGAAATLGGTGTAQAAIYTGNWDPALRRDLSRPGLERHRRSSTCPDACLALGNGTNIPISGPCAGFNVLSAQVDFYDIADPEHDPRVVQPGHDVIVNGIDIAGGQLTGIDTGFFDYFVPTLAIAGGGTYSFSLLLYGGNLAQLIYANPHDVVARLCVLPGPRRRSAASRQTRPSARSRPPFPSRRPTC